MELPIVYQEYLRSLRSRLAQEGFTPEDVNDISRNELIDDTAHIEHLNIEIRSFKALWSEGQTTPGYWPDDYLIIGESGSGNYYCISKSGSFPGVVEFEHEITVFTPLAQSLDDYYLHIIQLMQPRKK